MHKRCSASSSTGWRSSPCASCIPDSSSCRKARRAATSSCSTWRARRTSTAASVSTTSRSTGVPAGCVSASASTTTRRRWRGCLKHLRVRCDNPAMPHRRRLLRIALAMLGTGLLAQAQAQSYPAKPIRFVVPYPPAGPLDSVARLLAQKVSESVKQPVIVDNKPGAGGNIGADAVAKAPADGYTIVMGAVATHAINPTLYASIPYDPIRDFIPVTQVASTPNVLVLNPSIPASTVREFIAY